MLIALNYQGLIEEYNAIKDSKDKAINNDDDSAYDS